MGNQLARTTQISPSEYYLQDLPSTYNLVLKEALGGGRIFKSVQCVHDEGLLLVKVYFKRGELGPDLKEHDRRLRELQTRLKNLEHSHVWPFQTWLETDKAAYLLRQYFFNNLHDRISTRPFLSLMEKKWLTFQLVYAVKQCHERGICHGDIKCENVLVTSWNWVYLADFASFKPTYLPSDNPSDFSFFFDTGGRRRCYLAPERFYDPSSDPPVSSDAPLKPAMDIFSMGCVIAELFLEGHELFDLSQLLAYRKGQYDPRPALQKIPDERIQDMILHMIQLDPPARWSPDEYLQTWAPTVFPSYFSPLLHKFFSSLVPLDTDTRVARTQYAFAEIRKQMLAEVPSKGPLRSISKGRDRSVLQDIGNAEGSEGDGGAAFDVSHLSGHGDVSSRFAATKYKAGGTLHRVKAAGVAMAHKQNPFKTPGEEMFNYKMEPAEIRFERAYTKGGTAESHGLNNLRRQKENSLPSCDREGLDVAMAVGGVKNAAASLDQQPKCEGMILIAALLCACVRNVRLPQARRGAIQLLHEAAKYCDNDARLQHILPYVVALLSDPAAIVRCAALQNMCNLLSMVENFPPSDAKIFPEYILPLLSMLPDDPEESVRIAYANNIHKIARASYRFLVSSQYLTEIGGVLDSPIRPQRGAALQLREVELSHLRETIARVIQELVMGHKQTPTIGRALLQHVGSLCPFFGQKQSNDFLLPILPAFLNDRDEQLRAVFFEHIVHVCLFVGQASLEAYLLPYIEQALSDVEETVIVNALECLAALCVHRLLRKRVVLEAVERASPLLCHPSQCVQRAAVTFVSATSATLEPVDSHAFLSPILRPFLRREPASLCSEDSILVCLKPPVSREVFNRVLSNVMLSQTLPETGAVKLRSKGRQRVAPIQAAAEFGGNQSQVGNSERKKADKEASNSSAVSEARLKHASPGKKSSAAPVPAPGSNERPSATENEDGEKMKAMEGYIRNLSSTMQTRMHNWEVENTEKLESSAVGLPPGVGAGYYSHYDGSSEGIPLYSVPLSERKSEGGGQSNLLGPSASSYNEDWSRIFGSRQTGTAFQMAPVGGSLGPASSQWAAIASNASTPSGEPMQRSIANVPIAPRFMAGSLYHAVSTSGPRRVYEVMREGGREGDGSYMVSSSDMGMHGMGNPPPIEPTFEVYPAPDSVTALLGSVNLGQSAIESSWRPKGVLIAHLQEHQRAVNEVSVSSDQIFFVSGSDDGTVKVWDCRRLERDISFRSRLTYDFPYGRVLCVKMLSDGHQVAAASSSGAIHVLNIDYQARLGGSNERYTGFSDTRKLDSDEGAIVSLQNFVPEGPPHLLYSTQRSRTHLWDLRSPKDAWVLKGDPAQGYTSATALDPNCNWLVTGTSRGVLTLWDLRFQVPVNSWQHPLGCPVESMCPLLPRTGTVLSTIARPFIYVAAGQDEIALWNAEDGSCHQVMRLAPDPDTELREIPSALAPQAPNSKFGPSTTASSKQSSGQNPKDYKMEELNEPPPRLGGVRALLPLAGGTGLLTGGTDCRVRMWDRLRPEHSYTVCGPSGKASEQVVYETSIFSGVRIIQEHLGGEKQNVHTQGRRSPSTKNGVVAAALDSVGCHRDCIRSIASAQVNQKILISSGRDGAIKVWK
ncbi:unnamed protein product [Calypogeia fissa]